MRIVWQDANSTVWGVRSPIVVKKCPNKNAPHACFNCVERTLK